VHERDAGVEPGGELGPQWRGKRRRGARIGLGRGKRLVGHKLRLHDHRGLSLQGLDLVEEGGDGTLGQGDEAHRGDAHRASGRRHPLELAAEDSGS
jgi:hypothetical protein